MISEAVIRTVISICPSWSILHIYAGEDWAEFYDYEYSDEHPFITFLLQKPIQQGLDALAAEAVRVVNALENAWVDTKPGWCVIRDGEPLCSIRDLSAAYGPNETENRLNAIAEFVEKGYLKDDDLL